MLLSLALILLVGLALSGIMIKLRLPGLLGMLMAGIILGPTMLNLISPQILDISKDLRQIALIIILTRAGLSLDLKDLKKVGRPALLMCFVPATFELVAVTLFAPLLLHISTLDAAILGAVLAAVSPAVVVPRMLKLMESGYGTYHSIPQMIMAGSSADDVYVIVLFAAFMGMATGNGFSAFTLLSIPISILLGILLGIISGLLLIRLFRIVHMRDTIKVLILLSTSFLFVTLESALKTTIPLSGLLAVMALGATILGKYENLAKRLSGKFAKSWVAAELLLFVLVGAAVDIRYIAQVGIAAVVLLAAALIMRMIGVNVCLINTRLNQKEKFFTSIAYLPKATVQAAIGSIPLAAGLSSGNIILSIAVLSIIITAPLGAIGIDSTYKKLLTRIN